MTHDVLVIPRIKDLLLDRMVYLEGEKYLLTPKGILFAQLFIYVRKILGIENKGG